MTKLTTERLEEIAKLEITEFSDGMDIAKDAYQSVGSAEIVLMARQLLAYEQAAKNPIAFTEACEISNMNATGLYMRGFPDSKQGRNIPIYAAPVLPKQSDGTLICEGTTAAPAQPAIPKQPDVTLTNEGETYKIIKAAEKLVRCKGRYHSEQNYRALAALFGVTVPDLPPLPADEAPAQPVSDPYKLKDAVADIRNSGVEIDADKIKAERDAINSPVIPDGWKLVPVEPTAEMAQAARDCHEGESFLPYSIYRAMLAAAPAQEQK